MKRLDEIFDIWYGVNLEVVNCEVENSGIPFVSRQSVNNGVVCYVKPIDGIIPNPAHTLSIAASGSVLTTFYHDYEYYSGRDVYIAKPIKPMSKEEFLFYCYVIEQNKYRYNYGRAANRTLHKLVVPTYKEIYPSIKIKTTKFQFDKTPISPNKLQLNTKEWKWFYLTDIFSLKRGKRLTKPDREIGITPLITAGCENEGVADYISNEEQVKYKNAITIDMFGFSCYRGYEFCCDDNILVLQNKHLTCFSGLFISSIISNDEYKCAYGRQYRQKTFAVHKIKLPIDPLGNPDWQWMEDYIKGLPYSGCL